MGGGREGGRERNSHFFDNASQLGYKDTGFPDWGWGGVLDLIYRKAKQCNFFSLSDSKKRQDSKYYATFFLL